MSYKKHFVSNDIAPSEMYEATAVDSGTDTISKAKAIDALERTKRIASHELHGGEVLRTFNVVLNSLINIMSLLPPANNSEKPNSSDLISRQAAIEALRAMQTYKLFAGDDMLLIDQAGAQTELMMLPPAQPEPHWIPVTERLPEENYLDDGYVEPSQYVLVYMSYYVCKVSRYWGHRKSKGTSDYVIPDWMDLEDHDGDNVLAWMPLPEPYKGVTE